MTSIPVTLDCVLDRETQDSLALMVQTQGAIAIAINQLVQIISASRFTYTINLGEHMPIYKSDKADFTVAATISAKDSEGNVIANAPIPAGHTFTVTSDNDACITATQDVNDPRIVTYHIGGPNADSTPSQANVTASLIDPNGTLIATGAEQVTVTVGDPTTIDSISLGLPTA